MLLYTLTQPLITKVYTPDSAIYSLWSKYTPLTQQYTPCGRNGRCIHYTPTHYSINDYILASSAGSKSLCLPYVCIYGYIQQTLASNVKVSGLQVSSCGKYISTTGDLVYTVMCMFEKQSNEREDPEPSAEIARNDINTNKWEDSNRCRRNVCREVVNSSFLRCSNHDHVASHQKCQLQLGVCQLPWFEHDVCIDKILVFWQDVLNIKRQYNTEGIERHANDHTSVCPCG